MKGPIRDRKVIEPIWEIYQQDPLRVSEMARKLNIPKPLAQVLLNRGITSFEEGEKFLNPSLEHLFSPFGMKDMGRAAEVLIEAVQNGERIAIYGDYDVDGITATALMYLLLRQVGGDVFFYVPDRLDDGYGINSDALLALKENGASFLLTVDCGIKAVEELNYAQQIGLSVIVTDHHRPSEELPDVIAVVNPWRHDCSYPFKELCGTGVAFKLGQALMHLLGKESVVWEYLYLVALATVADVVPLYGENRVFVAHGLKQVQANLPPGLRALCDTAGLDSQSLSSEDIAYVIAPRLNAAGRMGSASRSLNLLLEKNADAAQELALELHRENSQRQAVEAKIFEEACGMVDDEFNEDTDEPFFLLLCKEGWHQGVLGVVASKMAEKYRCPVIILSLEEGVGKGSGRSFGDFNLVEALKSCSSLLIRFGGHTGAAGLTLLEECIPSLRKELNNLAKVFFSRRGPVAGFYVDAYLNPKEIDPQLIYFLEKLQPFGFGNPRPLFCGEGWFLEDKKEVGKTGRHLQLLLKKEERIFPAISFNGNVNFPELEKYRVISPCFNLSFNRWRGEENLQLVVQGFQYGDEFKQGNLTLVDRRNSQHKQKYLRELLRREEGVLVFVNTFKRMESLEKVFPNRRNLFFSHQGSIPAEKFTVKVTHLLLYDLPLRYNRLKELISFLQDSSDSGKIVVHLAYGGKDFEENFTLLLATVPSAVTLEQVFNYLWKMAVSGSISHTSAREQLLQVLPFPATRPLLDKSMAILKDAAYLDIVDERIRVEFNKGENFCGILERLGKIKSFLQEKKLWAETLSCQKFLLEAEGGVMLNHLQDL